MATMVEKDQFAEGIDHFSERIACHKQLYTGGERGYAGHENHRSHYQSAYERRVIELECHEGKGLFRNFNRENRLTYKERVMKNSKTTPANKKTPANGQAAKADAPRRNNPTNRSEKDDEDYDGSNFDNEDYNGKNFKDEDDYNSGKLGRGAEEAGEDDIKDIPRRKSKN